MKLFLIECHGYDRVYVLADSFDAAREKWLEKYINVDDEGDPIPAAIPKEEWVYPMPDTIAHLADEGEIIL